MSLMADKIAPVKPRKFQSCSTEELVNHGIHAHKNPPTRFNSTDLKTTQRNL